MLALWHALSHTPAARPLAAGKGIMKSDSKVRFHKDGKVGGSRAGGQGLQRTIPTAAHLSLDVV